MPGLLDHPAFERGTLTRNPGDFIVAFSDGVTEAMNEESEKFSNRRLLECIESHSSQIPQEVRAAPLTQVRAFCGEAKQNDDGMIVMARYDGRV